MADRRLFKVAKELNIGTDTVVEFLHKHGHKEVENDLNTKIGQGLYELLLKHFSPAGYQKLKSGEKTSGITPSEEVPPKITDLENENQSPQPELRNVLQKKNISSKNETTNPLDVSSLRRKVVPQTKPQPLLPEKEKELIVAEKEIPSELITENDISIPEKKPIMPEIVILPEVTEVVLPNKEETPVVVTEKTVSKEEEKVDPKPKIVKKLKILPNKEQETPIKVDKKPFKKEIITNKESLEEEEEAEPIEVIRASENVPQLSGLKVIGKIQLEDEKKKKDKKQRERIKEKKGKKEFIHSSSDEENQVRVKFEKTPLDDDSESGNKRSTAVIIKKSLQTTPPPSSEESEEDKKRKRKRKRKKGSTGNEQGTTSPIILKKGDERITKKEKVDDKEIQKTIRTTLSEMQKGAGRLRQRARREKRDERAREKEEFDLLEQEQAHVIRITEFITANEFASLLDISVTEILTKCFQLGLMVSINQRLDAEILNLIASEYDYTIEFVDVKDETLEEETEEDKPEDIIRRNPVITVMGHVDHGKTTLLDNLRKANVAASEAGGITQHIGAYQVKLKSEQQVTFLDTPGHEAFTAMRARGTKVTDVVIIVIAADDSIMPTTKEAISHAQAAGVPMVFAINKIDKPGADPERIRTQLAAMNLLVEEWGGKYQCQEISAKFGKNVDELLEKVMIESEFLDLSANPKRHASGSVIESRLDKGRGNVVTVLVQNGTLKIGDSIVAGIHSGKVRALINQNGERVKEAGPSTPVQVLGISGQPQAGDKFQVYEEESKAKSISQKRQELFREQQLRQTKRITLEEIGRRKLLGNFKELNLVIKGDVDGSVEALSGSMLKLSTEEIAVNIILKGVGQITESDVLLASASDAVIIAFNVRPGSKAKELAEKEGVNIRTYSIIYQAIEDITHALEGMLAPTMREDITANVEVRQVFNISKVGNIAGCYVSSGKVTKTDKIRVIREGVVITDSSISALKHYKEDVKEVSGGYECGIQIHHFNDIKVGDSLECYRITEIKKTIAGR